MSRGLRLLVVDDTRLYAEALASRLARCPDVREVVQAGCIRTATGRLADAGCDVVLLNAAMEDSLGVLHAVLERKDPPPTLALGVSELHEEVVAVLEQGAAGYLPRHGTIADLMNVIASIAARTRGPRLRRTGGPSLPQPAGGTAHHATRTRLTRREVQVVALVATGMTNQAIADRLGIQVRTVKNHVHNILMKLGVNRREEAVARIRAKTL